MLDEFRNISILNHFLQNVTCSMWDVRDTPLELISPTSSQIFRKNNSRLKKVLTLDQYIRIL